ncbi:hypothetical protein IQ06DRAFT_247819 [Phaeosphaeriaceae sp. SRC1lsM3a]|nr:hypothetical protein IQ06DRAFT_247819 [Stagonospora sp. SRC1lsM3a]
MRSCILLGAAALVAGSPAPQGFNPASLDSIPVTITQGPPVLGPAQQTGVYAQAQAQNIAAAAATGAATAVAAKRDVDDVEKRAGATKVSTREAVAPNPTSTNTAPSTCTPVGWTNTYVFTSIPACPTQVVVGTSCGFVNPDDPCAAQPNAYGPNTSPDTVDNFKSNRVYADLATKAKTPSGYDLSFSNYDGSVSGSGYLGYQVLTSYDPSACSALCAETKTCTGFNIFIERDPKWNPEKCSCEAPSIAQIKCSLWGQDVKKDSATNKGQHRSGFEVVIVASNGYNKKPVTPPSPPSCSKPQNCGHNLHDHLPFCLGEHTFPGPFDPSLCAAFAQTQNAVNKAVGLWNMLLSFFGMGKASCVQFSAAYLEKDGKGFGTNCRLFTKKFTPSQATLDISGSGDWGCQKSYTWDVDVNAQFNWAGWSW